MRQILIAGIALALLAPPAMAGVAEWDKFYSAGTAAYQKGDLAEAEKQFQAAVNEVPKRLPVKMPRPTWRRV